jgi:response regulator RpfG family c-di-GMP phosphodiesterase
MSTREQRVLIVDDERSNIHILAELLNPICKTLVAKDGEQALGRALSDQPPDLILLDIQMPEMDGYEVCRSLKAHPKGQDIPVIFVTCMAEAEDEAKGFALGAVDYITKPFNPHLVLARVKTHLQLKQKSDLLVQALEEIKTLRGILPICSYCKKIRDDKGAWQQVEVYLKRHSDADFSHGICPDCYQKYFPEL